MNKVLVIVVTYNAMQWVDRCLNSIFSSSIPLDVYIVDNGSTDGSQDYIKSHYSTILFYQSRKNLGFGRANNIGMQYAIDNDYDYAYLLNQDAWLMPDTIEELISIHKENSCYGILSPFQLQANMQHLDTNFALWVCSWESNKFLLDDLFFHNRKSVYSVPMVMAAHWLISKDCLKLVGGFSPTFPHYGEDNNYTNRVWYHGYKVGIVPSAIAVHDREFRKETKEKDLYITYITNLSRMSYIYCPEQNPMFRMSMRMLMAVMRFSSLKPIAYYFRIWREYRNIKRNIEISKGKCAFLHNLSVSVSK